MRISLPPSDAGVSSLVCEHREEQQRVSPPVDHAQQSSLSEAPARELEPQANPFAQAAAAAAAAPPDRPEQKPESLLDLSSEMGRWMMAMEFLAFHLAKPDQQADELQKATVPAREKQARQASFIGLADLFPTLKRLLEKRYEPEASEQSKESPFSTVLTIAKDACQHCEIQRMGIIFATSKNTVAVVVQPAQQGKNATILDLGQKTTTHYPKLEEVEMHLNKALYSPPTSFSIDFIISKEESEASVEPPKQEKASSPAQSSIQRKPVAQSAAAAAAAAMQKKEPAIPVLGQLKKDVRAGKSITQAFKHLKSHPTAYKLLMQNLKQAAPKDTAAISDENLFNSLSQVKRELAINQTIIALGKPKQGV
jgi:hypothetical protein